MLLAIQPLQIFAKPRPPAPPWPETELQRWSFDEPLSSTSAKGLTTSAIDTSTWQESWIGYALARAGNTVNPYVIPMFTTNKWNFTPEGSIRLWYSPNWSSHSASGNGPGHVAKLLEVSLNAGKKVVVAWDLHVSPNGDSLVISGDTDNGSVDYLATKIAWTADKWHLVTLSYTTNQAVLYVDDKPVASGEDFPVLPLAMTGMASLTIGSAHGGRQTGEGLFDELTTFPQPTGDWELNFYYASTRQAADLGPVTPAEEVAAELQVNTHMRTMQMSPLALMSPMAQSALYTNGFYFLTPIVQGTNISFTLVNTDTNKSYDIYFVPALFNSNNVFSIIAAHGSQGQTNFTASINGSVGFYRATEGTDWDGDGVVNWEDSDPYRSAYGRLQVIIYSPLSGAIINN